MNLSKQTVAQRLAEAHYTIEDGIELIVELLSTSVEQEASPREPIKLLEVNRDTTAAGIHPLFFGPHPASGNLYPSVIIEVTPREYEQIQRDPSSLPNGWRLGREFARPILAGQS